MSSLIVVIRTVSQHPELYLGKPSVQRLYAYIGGYLHQNNAANDHCLDGFNEYIAAHYSIKSDHNWADIIEFFAESDQAEIALFATHFERFIKLKTGQGDGSLAPSPKQ